ncbi:MAG: metallophosphoesterase [Spirochaetales bacterium]|nr:metallophosphoesterase [Spirochaetales bacterium]
MSLNLRILHISDLHFKTAGADPAKSFGADVVTASMIAEITAIMEKGGIFDFIVITGDLAFSGQKEQYKVAEIFCQKLL